MGIMIPNIINKSANMKNKSAKYSGKSNTKNETSVMSISFYKTQYKLLAIILRVFGKGN